MAGNGDVVAAGLTALRSDAISEEAVARVPLQRRQHRQAQHRRAHVGLFSHHTEEAKVLLRLQGGGGGRGSVVTHDGDAACRWSACGVYMGVVTSIRTATCLLQHCCPFRPAAAHLLCARQRGRKRGVGYQQHQGHHGPCRIVGGQLQGLLDDCSKQRWQSGREDA